MANNLQDRKPFKPPFEIIDRKTKTISIKYKDCLRNHAPQLGVNVVDGCGEFAPKRRTSHVDFGCGACGCHRNFHRKEVTKKITLKFVENEQANWFPYPHQNPQSVNYHPNMGKNDEDLIEKMKKTKN